MQNKTVAIYLILLFSSTAFARPELDTITICYEVKNNKKHNKTPCIVTNSGGAGVSVLTYNINGKDYEVVSSAQGNTLNGKKYTNYLRDDFFDITKDENKKKFYCYRTEDKKIEFCSAQPDKQ